MDRCLAVIPIFYEAAPESDPPSPLKKGEQEFKVPLFKGDLGGSGYLQRPIKLL
jgi:hypothetical protein